MILRLKVSLMLLQFQLQSLPRALLQKRQPFVRL